MNKKTYGWLSAALVVLMTLLAGPGAASAQSPEQWGKLPLDVNMYLCNDLGRNGYYEQKNIAELMGVMTESIDPECVIAAGDIHHFNGVASVSDPLWMTNFEQIYTHPGLMLDWYPILGNHEYRGNTQAVIDYAGVSRRWVMPSRYYTRVVRSKGVTVRLVFIDTTPLIQKYRKDAETYPDAGRQDMEAQLSWLEVTLGEAREDWVICIGHHPIYADTPKSESERTDMQQTLLPVLRRHKNVAMYLCGHIHNFQHIRKAGDNIDYVVNSSASLSRKVKPVEGTVFCDPGEGFSIISADKNVLRLYMVDKQGNVIHTVEHLRSR